MAEIVFAGVAGRARAYSATGMFAGESAPKTLAMLRRSQRFQGVGLANNEISAPKLGHLSLILPTLMAILEECGEPLDVFDSNDRARLLWWILRLVEETGSNPDLAESDILRAAMRIYGAERWPAESAKNLALGCGAMHAAANLFDDAPRASARRAVLETEAYHSA